MSLTQSFKNPTSEYRGKPFWAWNGDLEPEELRRQIRIFRQMGMGGAFLHSRVGLATEFLGEAWFECIRACVDECRQLGLEAWLYDEDRWPSGAAGGLVTKDPRYRMQMLVMDIIQPKDFKWKKNLLGAWQCQMQKDAVVNLEPLSKGEKPHPASGNKILSIYPILSPRSSWYNGYTYLDTMSEEAVKKFIQVAYQPYKRQVGKDFGKVIPGVFTDEPNYFLLLQPLENETSHAVLPWTKNLLSIFKKRYGYDLTEHLPELFFDLENHRISSARYHYYDCLTHLFTHYFARLVGRWCEKNNLLFTGHILLEESLRTQTIAVGSTMRFYEHMQAPGIDVLTQHTYEYDTAKQCASVANQMGRKWLLSELYGCTGWDFSFEGHKAIGDWQTALGVNLRCHHLSWYTMKGEAKRDYPASIFFQSPWWEYYRVIEDYYSRLHVALTQGKPVRRLLVIHPIESAWIRYRPPISGIHDLVHPDENSKAVLELDQKMTHLRNWLLEGHIDFDYGDEEMLSRLGSVRKAKPGALLRLGKADYDAVLVSPQLTIRKTTLDILEQFKRVGGEVIFAGQPPEFVDGMVSKDAMQVAGKCTQVHFNRKSVFYAMLGYASCVSIQDERGREVRSILYMLREDKDRHILFICNTNRKKAIPYLKIKVRVVDHKGKVVEWNPMTGERWGVKSLRLGEWVEFETDLPATGSRLFSFEAATTKLKEPLKQKVKWIEQAKQSLGKPVGIQLSEPNVLVLDRPAYKIAGERWKGPQEILKIDDRVRAKLGIPQRGCQMVQPWAQKKSKQEPYIQLSLRYSIQVKDLPRTPIHLVMETPERFKMSLNGVSVSVDTEHGWWVDPALRKIPIDPSNLRQGINELLLEIDFRPSDDLEAIFLIGDFGVTVSNLDCILTTPPKALKVGNWVSQKLPFYGGAVTYRYKAKPELQKGNRVILSAPDFKGGLIRVLVEGKQAGFLPWPPYEVDITDSLSEDEVEIALEVFGSRRNCFGPLHLKNPEPKWVGPLEYRTEGEEWQEDYHLKPCGLFKTPDLIYRKKDK